MSTTGVPEHTPELAHLLFSNQDRDATLHSIAVLAQSNLQGCAAASVTVLDNGQLLTAVSSSELALVIDECQYDVRKGPCVDAIRERQPVLVSDYAEERRWPEVARRALAAEITSSLALPLVVAGEALGALNLYGRVLAAFTADEPKAVAFAQTAAITLANALAFHRAAELSSQLAEGLESRDVIGQAKGILMATRRINDRKAFDRLRETSQQQNRKLRDVAADIVAETNEQADEEPRG